MKPAISVEPNAKTTLLSLVLGVAGGCILGLAVMWALIGGLTR